MEANSAIKRTNKWVVLTVLGLAWFVGYFDRVAMNIAAIPMSKEFALNPTQMGAILGSYSVGTLVVCMFGGMLADKYGSKKVLLFAMILWSVFTGFTAVASSFAILLVIRSIFGAAEGLFPPASSVAIAEDFPKSAYGRAKSFLLASGGLGQALGAIVVAFIVVEVGWRGPFYIFAVLGLLIAALLAILNRRDRLYHAKLRKSQQGTDKAKKTKVPIKVVFKNAVVWKVLFIQFALGFFSWGLTSWFPQYWVNEKGLSLKTMGSLLTIPSFVAFLAVLATGWVVDKYFVGREKHLLFGSIAFTAVSIFLMYGASSVTMGFVYQTIATVGSAFVGTTNYAIVLKYVRKEHVGTATGLNVFGSSAAGIIAPILMGYSITLLEGSYAAVFGMIVAILVCAAVVAATIKTNKQDAENEIGEGGVAAHVS
ncbi:MFS transporter [Brevibacillus centrosporus]|uniref:MFS transporter n=1 Tax=Brevibacillus centrosporus TaxID=54910 RepID=UPI002E209B79|nr:MFS transporter [Brevibacillus centrosporus]